MITKQKIKNFFFHIKESLINLRTNQTFLICCLMSVIYLISGYCKWLEIGVSLCAIIAMIFLPIQNAFCIFMFAHSFTLSNLRYDSWFAVTMVGFCLILLIKYWIGVKKGKYPYYKKLVATIASFYLVATGLSLFNPLYSGAWIYFIYLPLAYLIFSMKEEFDIAQGMNYMFGGLLVSCSLGFATLIFPHFQYNAMFGNRFRAFINNPNYLYMRAVFILSYYMFRYCNNNISHIKFFSIYLICAVITLTSLSKTGIVMFVLISVIFAVMFLKQDFKKRIKIIGILLLVIILIYAICYNIILSLINRFLESFNSNNFTNSLLTGRDEIWTLYFDAIFDNPWKALFGHGLLTKQIYIAHIFGPTETHSFYVWLLYRFGIIGIVALGYIICLFIKLLNKDKPKFIAYLPLIFILLESFCDNTMKCYNITYFIFALMILFMECKEKPIERQPKNLKEQEKN